MEKKTTLFAKIGMILLVIEMIYNHFFYTGNFLTIISLIGFLSVFFTLNFLREWKENLKSKYEISTFYIGSMCLIFGLVLRIASRFWEFDFHINLFLISISFFSIHLFTNGLQRVKENKKHILLYLVYYIVFLFTVVTFKFYVIPDGYQNEMFFILYPLISIIAWITFVVFITNSIKKSELVISKYTQLKLFVLLIILCSYIFPVFHRSIPRGALFTSMIDLAIVEEENKNQIQLGNYFVNEQNKKTVLEIEKETSVFIKKIDSIKFCFISRSNGNLNSKIKLGNINLGIYKKDKIAPLELARFFDYRINPYYIINLRNYDLPYVLLKNYRKRILHILFPKITNSDNFYLDYYYNSQDLMNKIIDKCKQINLTSKEQKLLISILMKDSHNEFQYNCLYQQENFDFVTLISAIYTLTNIQHEVLSTRALIISNL